MSLELSSPVTPRKDKEVKLTKLSMPMKTLSTQLQNAVENRRSSGTSIQAVASGIQSVFFTCSPNVGVNSCLTQEEEMSKKGSESSSGEHKNKVDSKLNYSVGSRNTPSAKIPKSESLKVQKKHYRHEKKRAAEELLSTLKDPSIVILTQWLKVRGSLKTWTKLWCVLKPNLLVLYKSNKAKSSHWIGTVLLNSCEILERPSKKDGFCFKIFHPLEQSIWATKGPKGESIGAISQPLPYSYLIFRAPSEADGKCWMDALELALRCSSLLMRTMVKDSNETNLDSSFHETLSLNENDNHSPFLSPVQQEMNESDCERHFNVCGMDDDSKTDRDDKDEGKSDTETDDEDDNKFFVDDNQPLVETPYLENVVEELGQQGDASQTEEVADENKSLIWTLVKQVRPGMDLSKVVLPTFILEPRSFLDKLADYYYHADFLSQAVLEEDPFTRIKLVTRWYLSGFYKKPKGLKKPYNPILGEVFRCYWSHSDTGSRTFYIAEQISHHPPVSAFYISNRQDGFVISGSILAKSKFYGNSLSAILDGTARLVFLKRGEEYVMTMPYAHCKGILIGTLTMELGGMITINCEKTGYHVELDFKLKPFLGTGEASNRIAGRIKLGVETLATMTGRWDQEIFISDKRSGETELFWNPTNEMKQKRLKRFTIPLEAQEDNESEKLWLHTSDAIIHGNQNAATHEKYLLEEEQRKSARERKAKILEWFPKCFERNLNTGEWIYKFADLRPWDPMSDIVQYEHNFVIQTKTRHQMPIVHTSSILNMEEKTRGGRAGHSRHSSHEGSRVARMKRPSIKHLRSVSSRGSGSSSTPPMEERCPCDSESSISGGENRRQKDDLKLSTNDSCIKIQTIKKVLEPLVKAQQESLQSLSSLQNQLLTIQHRLNRVGSSSEGGNFLSSREIALVAVMMLVQILFAWWFRNKPS